MAIRKLLIAGTAFVAFSCGQEEPTSQTKIIGGQDVKSSDKTRVHLSTVALTTDFDYKEDGNTLLKQGKSFCSGTIIGKRTISTAAHCVEEFDPETNKKTGKLSLKEEKNYVIFFGTKVDAKGKFVRAKKVISHPDWDLDATLSPKSDKVPNDIAVIVLEEDIPKGYKIAKIADPKADLSSKEIVLAGFGVSLSRMMNDTGVLRMIGLKVEEVNTKRKTVTAGQMLQGACGGDSGGPMYVKSGKEYQVIGATSTGADLMGFLCLGMNSNYTDIRQYKDWLAKHTDDKL